MMMVIFFLKININIKKKNLFFYLDYKAMANRIASLAQAHMDKLSVTKTTWGQQFQDAITVNRGDLKTAKFGHYIGHALAFFWKVIF
jgi:solute carrier family 8 (sodium/calcium exchanger)